MKRLLTFVRTDLFQQIFKGGSVAFIVRCLGIPIGLLAHILMSRSAGVEVYGQYTIIMSICLLLVIPTKLGFDFAALRFGAIYWSNKQFAHFRSLIKYCSGFMTLNLGVIALGLFGFFLVAPQTYELPEKSIIIWLVLLIGSLAALEVFSSFLRAVNKIFLSQFYEQIFRTSALVLLCGGAVVLSFDINLSALIIFTAISAFISVSLLLWNFRHIVQKAGAETIKAPLKSETLGPLKKSWMDLSLPSLFIVAVQQLMVQGNVIILGLFVSPVASAQYAVAFRLAMFVPFALTALNAITAPMIAVEYQKRDFEKLSRIVSINSRMAFLAACGVSAVFVIFGHSITALFGDGFTPAYVPLCILIIGGIVSSAVGSVGYFMTMTGYQNSTLKIAVLALCVNFILAIILIPRYGLIGAGISATCGTIVFTLGQFIFIRCVIGVDTSVIGLPNTEKAKDIARDTHN